MENKAYSGVIELQPQLFCECPDYATLGLRTDTGQFIEVFLSATLVSEKPTKFQLGRRLNLTGGEWYITPDAIGVGEYVRWWPASISYDA